MSAADFERMRRRIAQEAAELRATVQGPDIRTLSELGGTVDEIKRLLTPALVDRLPDNDLRLLLARNGYGGNYIAPEDARQLLGVSIWGDETPWTAASPRPHHARRNRRPEPPGSAEQQTSPIPISSRRGRKPKNWWPELAAELAYYVHLNGVPVRQAELEDAMLQALINRGHDKVGRSTIQPAITLLFDLFRANQ